MNKSKYNVGASILLLLMSVIVASSAEGRRFVNWQDGNTEMSDCLFYTVNPPGCADTDCGYGVQTFPNCEDHASENDCPDPTWEWSGHGSCVYEYSGEWTCRCEGYD